jgi:FKBP-type peptidyl-prolyl cis-trans isomerase SlpA
LETIAGSSGVIAQTPANSSDKELRSQAVKIAKGRRVRIKVKLSVVGGDVLEETVVEYFAGSGTMLPGLETILEGLVKGDKRDGVIKAKNAFGSKQHQPKKDIPRAEFPKDAGLKDGLEFVATAENGQNIILRVESFDDDAVHVVMLHPLHKKDIAYDVEVLRVTDPAPPPLPADAIARALSDSDD